MRSGVVMSSEVAAAGGALNAAYYLDRKDGETYEQWRERHELETWIANRITLLEKRLATGPSGHPQPRGKHLWPLWELKRELYLHELALLRMRAQRTGEEMG